MRFFSSSTGARGKSYHKGERAALLQEVNRLAYRIFHRKAYRLYCAGRNLDPAVVARDLRMCQSAAYCPPRGPKGGGGGLGGLFAPGAEGALWWAALPAGCGGPKSQGLLLHLLPGLRQCEV